MSKGILADHARTRYQGIIVLMVLATFLAACSGSPTKRSAGEVLDDTAIATKVKASLLADGETDGLDIDVDVDRGKVRLSGFADSEQEIAQASKIARSISGVQSVDNRLSLAAGTRSAGRYVDDKLLLARVKGALTKNADTSAFEINVDVNRGVVSLSGFVDSDQERRAAESVTSGVNGVEKVLNNLSVR
ncbi:MAG: BON domain-containing protein [Pseudomonadales bacterium]